MTNRDDGLKLLNANTDGQSKRFRNEIAIEDCLRKLCPMIYEDLVARISIEMHLSPDTVKYSFLRNYFRISFIVYDAKSKIVTLNDSPSDNLVVTQSVNDFNYKCKNCGNPVPNNTTFCSKDCVELFKTKEENKNDKKAKDNVR